MKFAAALPLAVLLPLPLAAQEAPELPDWLSGCWEASDGERWVEECWTVPRAGIMLGSGRSGDGETLLGWETMRIALDEPNGDGPNVRMAFLAAPMGGTPTLFAWSPGDPDSVTFINTAHDYPQRIRYWREGRELMAEISLVDGSNPMRWTYRRMGD